MIAMFGAIDVRPAAVDEVSKVAAALADAFVNDPVFEFLRRAVGGRRRGCERCLPLRWSCTCCRTGGPCGQLPVTTARWPCCHRAAATQVLREMDGRTDAPPARDPSSSRLSARPPHIHTPLPAAWDISHIPDADPNHSRDNQKFTVPSRPRFSAGHFACREAVRGRRVSRKPRIFRAAPARRECGRPGRCQASHQTQPVRNTGSESVEMSLVPLTLQFSVDVRSGKPHVSPSGLVASVETGVGAEAA